MDFNQITEEEYRHFLGKKADYYLKKFDYIENVSKTQNIFFIRGFKSWNWIALITSIFWVGYRKMYGLMLSIAGIMLGLDIILYIMNINLSNSFAYNTALAIVVAGYGNVFYYRYSKKKILYIKQLHQNNDIEKYKALERAGGTSWLGVLISLLAVLASGYICVIIGIY